MSLEIISLFNRLTENHPAALITAGTTACFLLVDRQNLPIEIVAGYHKEGRHPRYTTLPGHSLSTILPRAKDLSKQLTINQYNSGSKLRTDWNKEDVMYEANDPWRPQAKIFHTYEINSRQLAKEMRNFMVGARLLELTAGTQVRNLRFSRDTKLKQLRSLAQQKVGSHTLAVITDTYLDEIAARPK